MSCPTCDGTMQLLTEDGKYSVQYFLCPRCGTVKMDEKDLDGTPISQSFVPALVERCREFRAKLAEQRDEMYEPLAYGLGEEWKRLGIAEAINKPEGRPR